MVKDGEVVSAPPGRTFFVTPECESGLMDEMTAKLKEMFANYYSVSLANYPVQDAYVPNPYEIRAPWRS